MKKYLCALRLLAALLLALPLTTRATTEDATVESENLDRRSIAVSLGWRPNPEPNIAGYNVYFGQASGSYVQIMSVPIPTATIIVRGSQTVYFAVTAYDSSGTESPLSAEVHFP